MDFGKIYEKKREVKKTDKVKHIVICAFAVLLVILFSLDGDRLFVGFSEMLGLCDKRDKAVAAIDFINVGQGSCSLISSDNEYALVDTGTETYEGIAPFNRLKNYGAGSIKYVFITHCHNDHIGGLFGLISNFKVENVVVYDKPVGDEAVGFYQKASEYCEQYGINVICPQNGMEFKLGKGSITAYIPPNGLLDTDENACTVYCGKFGETRALFMGDSGFTEEDLLLNEGFDLSCDILAVGHHGSKYSTGVRLLDEVSPKAAVISFGYNTYGHPTQETLQRLEQNGCEYFYTFGDSKLCAEIYNSGFEMITTANISEHA